MAALPTHTLYYVVTGRMINGPRQLGEVIDVDELQIRNALTVLENQGAIMSVPFGSELVEQDGITFVNAEFAAEYAAYLASFDAVEEEEAEDDTESDDANDDGSDADANGEEPADASPVAETKEELLHRIGNLNKADLTAEAEALGVTVDPDWTKADIIAAVEALG